MEGDLLKAELDQVTSELAEARTEYAILGARIAGLEARGAALTRAIPGAEVNSDTGIGSDAGYRTEAIVELMTENGGELSIKDVIALLHDAGRPNESYDNVSADLAYLAEKKRISRVRRGVYAGRHEPQVEQDRIVIPLTQGNINNNHLYLARHLNFFPTDSIGTHNKQAGTGALLTLHFSGTPYTETTDIAPDHKIFRIRGKRWQEFFKNNGLRAGDQVAVTRLSEYEYRIGRADVEHS
jgi:hypothetical protein